MPDGTALVSQPGFQKQPLNFPTVEITVVNRTGGAILDGDVHRFNTIFTDGAAIPPTADSTLIDIEEGSFTGMWAELFVNASTNHDSCHLCCVAAEDIADGLEGKAFIRGIVQARAGAIYVSGIGLTHSTNTDQIDVATSADKVDAIALGATVDGSPADGPLSTVLFDGIKGFGRGKAP